MEEGLETTDFEMRSQSQLCFVEGTGDPDVKLMLEQQKGDPATHKISIASPDMDSAGTNKRSLNQGTVYRAQTHHSIVSTVLKSVSYLIK